MSILKQLNIYTPINMEDKLSKAFGVEENQEYLNAIVPKKPTVPEVTKADEDRGDYDLVRDNIKELIGKGTMALDDLLELAKQSESLRAYETIPVLLKTLSDQNKDLIDIHVKTKGKEKEQNPQSTNINNALFVGSTADLLKGLLKSNDS